MGPPQVRRPRRRVSTAAPLLARALLPLLVLLLAGCGSGSAAVPLAGVDDLVVPTPSPDPADFVDVVDNPWLPLRVGTTWTYAVDGDPDQRLVVTVTRGPDVAGLATTAVRRTPPEGASAATLDYYAQDTAGNVWWCGREGEWLAGEDGAEAGVAMLARPRVGDGYREALAPGVDVRSEIVALDGEADVPAGRFGGLLVIETTDGALTRRLSYAEGAGLVEESTTSGLGEPRLGLVAVDQPR